MLIPSSQSSDHFEDERSAAGVSSATGNEKEETGAVYTCKFPGCTRQYASTDGARARPLACMGRCVGAFQRMVLHRAHGLDTVSGCDTGPAWICLLTPPCLSPALSTQAYGNTAVRATRSG
jgi:hypothetical protein